MTSALPERLGGPALAGLWRRCWKAMAKSGPTGWPSTTVRVPVADDEERRALAGLLGRPVRPGTGSVAVGLGLLDGVVRRAGDGWDLPGVVEAAAGPLPDRAGVAGARSAAIAGALASARACGPNASWFEPWLEELAADGTLARLDHRGELGLAGTAASILARLPADGVPLPVLAAQATGDTKALSRGTLPSLVLRGLASASGEPRPTGAAERRDRWEAAGVVADDLSSQVLVLNLPAAAAAGSSPLARWLAEAAGEGLPFRVTLHQLTRSPLAVAGLCRVYVCENPAVLRAAAERLGAGASPLVCTEGRPSVACTRLLTTVTSGGGTLAYHGDFDWPGLGIAAAVLARPGAESWRFGAHDYRSALAAPPASIGGRRRLAGPPAASPWDPALAEAMADAGEVVYEEDVLEALLIDLDN
ncbi:MAG: TIGR02679 family protein [Acidimicrobiales bacterium]